MVMRRCAEIGPIARSRNCIVSQENVGADSGIKNSIARRSVDETRWITRPKVHILKTNGEANEVDGIHWARSPEIVARMEVLRTLVQLCFKVNGISVILDQEFSEIRSKLVEKLCTFVQT